MITTTALTKSYGKSQVVRNVSLHCAPGTITGFLGPNGAGKSTTLRMVLGLSRPDSGTSTIAGRPFTQLPNPTRVIGTLLDPTAMNRGRSGRATLTIAARMAGVPVTCAGDLLDRVGLTEAADRRVGDYSLGMRQRLGIAQALVGRPQVLILDEPANGLDPEGIFWMRGLLRDFADRGGTVLLSSHLLREVEAVADRLVVIGRGRVVAQGGKDDLLAATGTYVRALDRGALERTLRRTGLGGTPTTDGGVTVAADAETLGRVAAADGLVLLELRPAGSGGLEQMFLTLT